MSRSCRILLAFVLAMAAGAPRAEARDPLTLIRDAEIEHIIRTYATPLFRTAGLDPAAIKVYLVQDKGINAFVAGGMNLFINTGLILAATNANQLVGVIAHETGHIAGGHIVRTREAVSQARGAALLATILGAAVIVAGGGSAGTGVVLGGTGVAERLLYSFSRSQENAADHAALGYLDATGQSARGLLEFFEVMARQELYSASRQDPYLSTHPLSRERIAQVRAHVERSPYADAPEPDGYDAMFSRMIAKLAGYLEKPETLRRRYPDSDRSFDARYARAIGLYRRPDVDGALAMIDELLGERPDDPFVHELRGQVLLESGRLAEALPSYERSVALEPDEPLLRVGLAQTLVALATPEAGARAIEELRIALRTDPDNAGAWRLMGAAHSLAGDEPMAALATAESALLRGETADAAHFAERALKGLAPDSPGWLRAQDILAATKEAGAP
jgi:predicted Zn-dependent protease